MDFKKIRKIDLKTLGYLERERNAARRKNERYKADLADRCIRVIRMYGYYTDDELVRARWVARQYKDYECLRIITELEEGIKAIREQVA